MTDPPDLHAQRMARHVEYLASDELEGRAPGTGGGLLARTHVREMFEELGLEPAGDNGRFEHAITAIGGANLLGRIPGSGPNSRRHVMVAAHYDHLGRQFGEVMPGADDNASGVAVLLEVARTLKQRTDLDRSILICAFDAEEPPHFYTETMGSIHWVERPTIALADLELMVCLDLIGHPVGLPEMPAEVRDTVFVMGAERAGLTTLVESVGAGRLVPRCLDAGIFGLLSDHYAFARRGVPFLFYTAGRDRHYHTPQDTAEKLDYQKMVDLADHVAAVVAEVANGPSLIYDADARDDVNTARNLVEIGRIAAPLHRDADRLSGLIERLSSAVATGAIGPAHRAGMEAALRRIEEALA